MKIYPNKLDSQLQQQLLPLYLLSGEETLLINEAADQIRTAAKTHGFMEREVFDGSLPGFQWNDVLQSVNNLSLFAEKKLVEVRCSKKQLNDKAFLDYWQNSNPDSLMLVITEKLDKTTLNTKWFAPLEHLGGLVQVWPLEAQALGQWLNQRARQQGLRLEPQALRLLQERTEGNLLAAAQELEKLFLLYGDQVINTETLEQATADHARYDVFILIEQCLLGHADRSLAILQRLLEEGQDVFSILRNLVREARLVATLQEAIQQGQAPQAAMKNNGIWEKRQTAYHSALKRLSNQQLQLLLCRAQQLDLAIMGLATQNVAQGLQDLCLDFCGLACVHPASPS